VKVEFRELNKDDEELVWNIVYVTADMEKCGETLEQAKQNPDRRRYICDWGKPFDYGIIAQTSGADSIFVGAAWMRLLKIENKGAGYIDDSTPELSIGVHEEFRKQGIGKALICKLIDGVRGKVPGICLSVRDYNGPAISLYESLGFEFHGPPFKNRVGTMSHKMLLKL
jgi:ribosomal protein S18 acetylase RimI-like enzyme